MVIMPFPFGVFSNVNSSWYNLWGNTSDFGLFYLSYIGNSINEIEWYNKTSASYQFNSVSSMPNYSYFAMGELLV